MKAPAVTVGRLSCRAKRVPGLPLVAVRAWLRGGALYEGTPGLALLTGRLLAEGAGTRTWQEIALQAEDRGMNLQSFGTTEAIGVAIDALSSDWRLAVRWLAEITLEPTFPTDRLEWLRTQMLAELESQLDQPEYRTGRAFLEQLYGPHPYGRALQGDASSLQVVDRAACATFHQQALRWGGCVVISGDIDEDEALAELELCFATAPREGLALPKVPDPVSNPERREVVAGESDQAHLFGGHLTLDRRHPDLPALDLGAVVLGAGAGTAGRIPQRIREQDGLAYSADVATASGAGLAPGRLVFYVGTGPGNVAKAELALREELSRLLEQGIADAELEEARSYLLGREPFRRETLRQWADLIAEGDLYDLPTENHEWVLDRYRHLRREDVEAVLRRHLDPSRLCWTLGKPGG